MVLYWIAFVSMAAFLVTGWDKYRAVKGRRRVSEARLLGLGLLGGSPGLVAAMLLFRHKTSKRSFQLAAGAIVVVQLGVLVWWAMRG